MEKLIKLYTEYTGSEPAKFEILKAAGSNRKYVRLYDNQNQTVIGVIGTSAEENDAFCYLSKHFHDINIPVPEVHIVSSDHLCYIQDDLGNLSLYDAISKGRIDGGSYSDEEKTLLRRTMSLLPKLQIEGGRELDFSHCYPQECMDVTNVMFDLNYFKYCFLKFKGIDFNEMKLELDFRLFASDLIPSEQVDTFLYRDFQARNIMLNPEGQPYFIDFQGGRRGPIYYDVASFLWQSSSLYSNELREELINVYISAFSKYYDVDEICFRKELNRWVLFRLLQVLGAYGFRGYYEKKSYFINSIPHAIKNLKELLSTDVCKPYPYLEQILNNLISSLDEDSPVTERGLTIRIFSFSFKKGIPEDKSGNGGGYVFDCRSTNNPGRYEDYKNLTGLDKPVIDFLEKDGEILTFLESVYKLADAHTERYIERGFTSLMFCFGCTGGQHRSVYSAQHLAEHLHKKYGVRVLLTHREQGIEQIFNPCS